jgi:hypothetical protein
VARKPKLEVVEEQEEKRQYATISKSKLKGLLASSRATKQNITEMSGALGHEIKEACENYGLHRAAYQETCKRDRMEPEKLAEYLQHVDRYSRLVGLDARAASAPSFDLEDAGNEAEPQAAE